MDRDRFELDFMNEYWDLPAAAQAEVRAYLRGLSDPRTGALTLLILKRRLAEHDKLAREAS
jgi:hypothetical protein